MKNLWKIKKKANNLKKNSVKQFYINDIPNFIIILLINQIYFLQIREQKEKIIELKR